MPTYQFEAMDATGQEIRDVIDAQTAEEAQATIRQMGYFVTKISSKRGKEAAAGVGRAKRKKSFTIGGVSGKHLTLFTRQLSILQDAGLPILRSLRILEEQQKPGPLKNGLIDVCDEIEGGATLSEAMAKCPKVFNRLYINMIKAGEAGGALETILRRLAEFMERAQSLKRKVIGAMIYPIVVIIVAVSILSFIMIAIVPVFAAMFVEFELTLPKPTMLLIAISEKMATWWWVLLVVPIAIFIFIKLVSKFRAGRMGWHHFLLKIPIIGNLIEKNVLARTTRTLGTLVASGVPILEGLAITRETSNNAMFEKMFAKVSESIREGETIAKPMKQYSRMGFHPVALFFWMSVCSLPFLAIMFATMDLALIAVGLAFGGAILGALAYLLRMRSRVVDDLVVNMVDVGEETGELDTMLYKVADYYDEEVKTTTDSLMTIIEPILIVFLGVSVGFIVISLFMPLIELITKLSGGGAG
jgi:type IV pilus assembly protein PilC